MNRRKFKRLGFSRAGKIMLISFLPVLAISFVIGLVADKNYDERNIEAAYLAVTTENKKLYTIDSPFGNTKFDSLTGNEFEDATHGKNRQFIFQEDGKIRNVYAVNHVGESPRARQQWLLSEGYDIATRNAILYPTIVLAVLVIVVPVILVFI